jgi:hypothetical protein
VLCCVRFHTHYTPLTGRCSRNSIGNEFVNDALGRRVTRGEYPIAPPVRKLSANATKRVGYANPSQHLG